LRRLLIISLSAALTISCSDPEYFDAFIEGEYSYLEECPAEKTTDGSVFLSRAQVQVEGTKCDVKSWKFVEDENSGIVINLHNCRSEKGIEESRQIILAADDDEDESLTLSGWSKSDRKIIECEY